MATVLVTGANGFIGRHVVSTAEKAGHGVTAIVRNPRLGSVPGMVRHDLRFPLAGLPPADWIFHLAGGYAGAGQEELSRADSKIAENIIDWGLKAGIKNWIIASAAEVYGDVEGIADEAAPTQPVIPYGRIKLDLEQRFVERLASLPGCRVVILRIGEVYGSQGRLMTELITRLNRGFCPWPGTGRVAVSFVHADDVAQAFLCALERARPGISIYNVVDDVPASWHDFVCSAALRLKAKPPLFLPVPLVCCYALCGTFACRLAHREPVLTQHALRLLMTPKALSNSRLKYELEFRPRYPSFADGMEEALSGLSHYAKDGSA